MYTFNNYKDKESISRFKINVDKKAHGNWGPYCTAIEKIIGTIQLVVKINTDLQKLSIIKLIRPQSQENRFYSKNANALICALNTKR